ncbi:hypothetical protein ABPG75_012089 [Micractinium tetrahymenae]
MARLLEVSSQGIFFINYAAVAHATGAAACRPVKLSPNGSKAEVMKISPRDEEWVITAAIAARLPRHESSPAECDLGRSSWAFMHQLSMHPRIEAAAEAEEARARAKPRPANPTAGGRRPAPAVAPTLDLELTAEEAVWLVQPHTCVAAASASTTAAEPEVAAAHTAPRRLRRAATSLGAAGRQLARTASGGVLRLRSALAAAVCLSPSPVREA